MLKYGLSSIGKVMNISILTCDLYIAENSYLKLWREKNKETRSRSPQKYSLNKQRNLKDKLGREMAGLTLLKMFGNPDLL